MWQEDRRITHCQVCLARLSCPVPSRHEMMLQFTGAEFLVKDAATLEETRNDDAGFEPKVSYDDVFGLMVSYSSHPSNKLSYVAWIYWGHKQFSTKIAGIPQELRTYTLANSPTSQVRFQFSHFSRSFNKSSSFIHKKKQIHANTVEYILWLWPRETEWDNHRKVWAWPRLASLVQEQSLIVSSKVQLGAGLGLCENDVFIIPIWLWCFIGKSS